jgi:hypothetical protein
MDFVFLRSLAIFKQLCTTQRQLKNAGTMAGDWRRMWKKIEGTIWYMRENRNASADIQVGSELEPVTSPLRKTVPTATL